MTNQTYLDRMDAGGETQGQRLIEADRKRRGEPVGILKRVAMGEPVFYSHDDKAYELPLGEHPLYAAPQPAEPVKVPSDDTIREVFLANGFTIKPGHDDLKPYVYDAARALLARYGHNLTK